MAASGLLRGHFCKLQLSSAEEDFFPLRKMFFKYILNMHADYLCFFDEKIH